MPDKTLFVSEKFASGNMPAFHTYRIDGRTIHYADIGDASLPLVVFVHGSPGSWKTFAGFMADPYLQDKVRMIAVDRPGFGQSESGREVKSLKRQAALLKPILDRNRSGSATILVGHSFGGPVISRMAMDYSDQVGALIMISPTIDPELENTSWYQHLVKVPLFKILIPKNLITANQEILPLKGELEKMLTHWNQIHVPVYLFHGERDRLVSPENASARVALIMGCVQGEIFPQTHEATIGVLEKLGCEVIAPPSQVCCGALHLHAGDMQKSRELAKKNIEVFEEHQVDAIIVNAAGCGSTLKEYGHLLREDNRWAKRATAFSNQVEDILEFVATRIQNENLQKNLSTLDINVTLQDSCHLAHAQGIREAPREILNQIPGLNLHEMRNPDRCCGSAGIYSLVQSEMSNSILATKMEDILTTESSIICTANSGCTLQLQSGVRQKGLDAEVLHVIDLLYRSLSQK